jgi:hypothetical protein
MIFRNQVGKQMISISYAMIFLPPHPRQTTFPKGKHTPESQAIWQ